MACNPVTSHRQFCRFCGSPLADLATKFCGDRCHNRLESAQRFQKRTAWLRARGILVDTRTKLDSIEDLLM